MSNHLSNQHLKIWSESFGGFVWVLRGWKIRTNERNQIGGQPKFKVGPNSFYFTNFPDTYGVEEMWKIFLKWGRVRDIRIPSKKNKQGKRFFFVGFTNVKTTRDLELKLYSIWIETYILWANIPVFDRGGVDRRVKRGDQAFRATNNCRVFEGGRSYVRAVEKGCCDGFGSNDFLPENRSKFIRKHT